MVTVERLLTAETGRSASALFHAVIDVYHVDVRIVDRGRQWRRQTMVIGDRCDCCELFSLETSEETVGACFEGSAAVCNYLSRTLLDVREEVFVVGSDWHELVTDRAVAGVVANQSSVMQL